MKLPKYAILPLIIALLTACSTTRKIADGEVLYTGVEDLEIITADSLPIDDVIESQLTEDIDVAPNASLISPYLTHPFPVGLWVYNWDITPETGKFKKWLYRKLSREPVLISSVRPELRVDMLRQTLKHHGYFASSASYSLLYSKKDPKKAKINYVVHTGNPYLVSDVEYHLPDSISVSHVIDSIYHSNRYIEPGMRYSVDSLINARNDVSEHLRRLGYYYFRPEYIEYKADSTIAPERIALRVQYAKAIPEAALVKYCTRNITTYVKRYQGGGTPDTLSTSRGDVIVMRPSRLRESLIPSCLTFRKGKVLSTRDISRSQSYLSRLGVFKNISIDITPIDSLNPGQDSLDVAINCIFDAPLEATLKFSGSYKSNSYLGPGVTAGLVHNNVFGGGEQFSVDLNASYEWQIGKSAENSASNNYYDFGVKATLAFPRLLAPSFITRTRRDINWTRITLGADIYNNPSTFQYLQVNAGLSYEWHTNRYSLHQLDLPELTFSKRIGDDKITGSDLVDMELVQPTVFIPKITYKYTFERTFGASRRHNIVAWLSFTEAGNILSGIWSLAGSGGGGADSKELFGVPFSQFVKVQGQATYSYMFDNTSRLVGRVFIGAGFPYGNSLMIPYGEDFYCGGPSSIRAFPIRSIGPGRFAGYDNWLSQYLRSGSFKFEMNLEYRFPILGIFKGAVFVDAGNVWMLKDPYGFYDGQAGLKASEFLTDLALGTGVGIRIDLDMIVARADLGVGIHTPYDTGKSSYYNMPSFKKSLALNFAIGYPF